MTVAEAVDKLRDAQWDFPEGSIMHDRIKGATDTLEAALAENGKVLGSLGSPRCRRNASRGGPRREGEVEDDPRPETPRGESTMRDPFSIENAVFTGPQTPEQERRDIVACIARCEDARDFRGLTVQRRRLRRFDKRHPQVREPVADRTAGRADAKLAELDAAKRDRRLG